MEKASLDHPSSTEWYNITNTATRTAHRTTANESGRNQAFGCGHRGNVEEARVLLREERRVDCDDDLESADPDVVVAEGRRGRRRPRTTTSELPGMKNNRSMIHAEGLDLLEAASASRLQYNRRPSSAVRELEVLVTQHQLTTHRRRRQLSNVLVSAINVVTSCRGNVCNSKQGTESEGQGLSRVPVDQILRYPDTLSPHEIRVIRGRYQSSETNQGSSHKLVGAGLVKPQWSMCEKLMCMRCLSKCT